MKLSKQTLINFAGKSQRYREFHEKVLLAEDSERAAKRQKRKLKEACEEMLLKECGFVPGDIIVHLAPNENKAVTPNEEGLVTRLEVDVVGDRYSDEHEPTIHMPKSVVVSGIRRTKEGEWSKGRRYRFRWSAEVPIHGGDVPIVKVGHIEVPE